MRSYKSYFILAAGFIMAAMLAGCKKDDPNKQDFGNRVYINSFAKTNTFHIKSTLTEETRVIEAATAKPLKENTTLTFKTEPSLVAKYNEAYYDDAVILPAENYEIPETKALIPAGSARSTEITINFKAINELDRNIIYVLPVTLSDPGGLAVLESARTMYYVFRKGALINVVADIEKNYCTVNWATPQLVNNMTQLTMEALVRARSFTRPGSDSEIVSIMGIESNLLIRCGDANAPGQIQVAMSDKNFPGKDSKKVLPANQWVHIAMTFDGMTSTMKIYVDGKLQSEGSGSEIGNKSSFNLTNYPSGEIKGFFIGASWNTNRWWIGEISECRIWNTVRTQEEIGANFYEVDPSSEGLVAYWKFDEGDGTTVKDHTGNGNNATAANPLKWTPVVLPPLDK